jgi:serine/threonine protein kinase
LKLIFKNNSRTELFKRAPLFPFSDEIDVVDAIYKLCGTPNNNFWPEADKLPRYKTLAHRVSRPRILRELFASFMPPVALDLVDKMLILNPNKRITAKDALESMWIINMKKKKLDPLVLPKTDCFEYRVKLSRKRKDA